jgi:hypothetical protein
MFRIGSTISFMIHEVRGMRKLRGKEVIMPVERVESAPDYWFPFVAQRRHKLGDRFIRYEVRKDPRFSSYIRRFASGNLYFRCV